MTAVIVGLVAVLVWLAMLAALLPRLLVVAPPNEIVVLSGGSHRGPDGTVRGYRVVRGGRAVRIPFIEQVDRLDVSNLALALGMQGVGARSDGEVALEGTANVRIAVHEPLLSRAIERFFGVPREQVKRVAGEIIEGNIREVAAGHTSRQLASDPSHLADRVVPRAREDLERLGLELDSLKLKATVLRQSADAAEPGGASTAASPAASQPSAVPELADDEPPWASKG